MFRRILTLLIATTVALSTAALAAKTEDGHVFKKRRMLGKGHPFMLRDLPRGRVRARLESLPAPAWNRAIEWLQRFEFPEDDLTSMAVDDDGAVLYIDEVPHELPADTQPAESPLPQYSATAVDEAFLLHSRPGASKVLFLDFDGHTFSNTAWSGDTIQAKALDLDGNPESFNNAERNIIAEVWHRVSEDFAAFDIDVTTEAPAAFGQYTGHVLITSKTEVNGNTMPHGSAGGVAYVGVYGRYNYATYYSPALVYYDNLGKSPTYIAEASSHEFGHNLGLSHDGSNSSSYYSGHGSGATSWAPIMGNGYSRNVTQWSKGEYQGANNTQDDLAIIAAKLSLADDDHGDTPAEATPLAVDASGQVLVSNPELDPYNDYPGNKGIIEKDSDSDLFSFQISGGQIDLTVTPAWDAFYRDSRRGANLDVALSLMDADGNTLASADPGSETDANIQANLPGGVYYLAVTGIDSDNYSDYASSGQYFISGSLPQNGDKEPPSAGFVFDCNDLSCSFSDSSREGDGSISAWLWDFGDGTSSNQPNPTHSFASVGSYAVSLRVEDENEESDVAFQNISVSIQDVTPPVVTAPGDITKEATAISTPAALGLATSDDGSPVTHNAPAGGFPLGITQVTWTATDSSGNIGTDTQRVTIVDTTPPQLIPPANVTIDPGEGVDTAIGTATAVDIFPVSVGNDAPASFPVGTTQVTWTATDTSGNTTNAIQVVTVLDVTAPVVTAPGDITKEATAISTPVTLGSATTDDNSPVAHNAPAGGFPLGITQVTWTATDASGNTGTDTQRVTIVDTTPPQLTPPANITIASDGSIGTATAVDIFPVSVGNDAPASFPVGTTQVTWTATDTSGNSANAVQTVTVEDNQVPGAINFNNYLLSSFSSEDKQGTAIIEDNGATLRMTGNRWKRIDFPYTISTDTVIELDFYSGTQGEIHGIGLENDNRHTPARIFKLHGTQNWGNNDFDNYSGNGWVRYRIPVGQFYTGNVRYLVFVMDDDSKVKGESRFRNVKIVEDQPPPPPPVSDIDFNNYSLSSFSSEDKQGTAVIEDDGATLRLTGNTWKRIDLPYTVSPDTVIEFDFYSGTQGEIHGIGLENDNRHTPARIFELHGTQNWGNNNFDNYPGSGWTHYRIPVGQYYTGKTHYLVFVMDDDANVSGESKFRNVRIVEDQSPPADGVDFNDYTLSAFSSEDKQGTATIEDNGATLRLAGNTWKRIDFRYTIGPNTVIEFDFSSEIEGEIHGIGLENNNSHSPSRMFRLYGSQNWGNGQFDNYPGSGWTHYRIPVGEFYTGDARYLVFATDDDAKAVGESRFRNLSVHEE